MEATWIILTATAGIGLGAILGWLWASRGCAATSAELVAAQQALADREGQVQQWRADADGTRAELADMQIRASRTETELLKERQAFEEKQHIWQQAEQRMKEAFAVVSQESLAKNNSAFLDLARSRFDPMKTLLEEYQKRLAELEQNRARTHTDIREQLGNVAESHRALSTQTAQIVTALTNPGTRGRWGEIGLERVLELSGMTPGIHFDAQPTFSDEDGRSRPDVCVKLPGERCIAIDAKYPAKHFFEALECEDALRRESLLRQHAAAVRSHANTLRSREYWRKIDGSPEFVVMYLAGEAMVYAAVQADSSLLEDMFRDRVIIATPTTLMALLKAVAHGWQRAEVEKGIEEVRALGAQMVERLAVFAEHFNRVGRSLDAATQAYNQAAGSAETRLLVTARKMKELGVSTLEIPDVQAVDAAARQLSVRENLFEADEGAVRDADDALV